MRRRMRAVVSQMTKKMKLGTYKINLALAGMCPGKPLLSTWSALAPHGLIRSSKSKDAAMPIGCRHSCCTRLAVAAAWTSRSAGDSKKHGSNDLRNVVSRTKSWLRRAFVFTVACVLPRFGNVPSYLFPSRPWNVQIVKSNLPSAICIITASHVSLV